MTDGHAKRVNAGGELFKEEGLKAWHDHRARLVDDHGRRLSPNVLTEAEIGGSETGAALRGYWERKKEEYDLASINEFALCYAYDVYRQGWQYLEHVHQANSDATYFPHLLRTSALDGGTTLWEAVKAAQNVYWSWGRAVVRLMETWPDTLPTDIENRVRWVADLIFGIYQQMDKEGLRWLTVLEKGEDGNIVALSPARSRDVTKQLVDVAVKAGFRLSPRPHEAQWEKTVGKGLQYVVNGVGSKLGSVLFQHLPRHFVQLLGPLSPFLAATSMVVRVVRPDLVYKVETPVVNTMATKVNQVQAGTFIVPGLFPGDGRGLPQRRAPASNI